MSKNECEFTLFPIDVNEIYATLTCLISGGYRSSTAPCHAIGAGDCESAISIRLKHNFSVFVRCENGEKNPMNGGFLECFPPRCKLTLGTKVIAGLVRSGHKMHRPAQGEDSVPRG